MKNPNILAFTTVNMLSTLLLKLLQGVTDGTLLLTFRE
jgi:hypothetical protein